MPGKHARYTIIEYFYDYCDLAWFSYAFMNHLAAVTLPWKLLGDRSVYIVMLSNYFLREPMCEEKVSREYI